MNQNKESKTLTFFEDVLDDVNIVRLILNSNPKKLKGNTKNNVPVFIKRSDYDRIKMYKWYITSRGYVGTSLPDGTTIFLHRLLKNANKGQVVDHKNGVKTDNISEHLEVCTPQQSGQNKPKSKNASCSYKGVKAVGEKFHAFTTCYGVEKYIGSYDDPQCAAKERDKWIVNRGKDDFKRLNFECNRELYMDENYTTPVKQKRKYKGVFELESGNGYKAEYRAALKCDCIMEELDPAHITLSETQLSDKKTTIAMIKRHLDANEITYNTKYSKKKLVEIATTAGIFREPDANNEVIRRVCKCPKSERKSIVHSKSALECALKYDAYVVKNNLLHLKINFPEHYKDREKIIKTSYNPVENGKISLQLNNKPDAIVLIDESHYDNVKHISWYMGSDNRIMGSHTENGIKKTVRLHRYIMEETDPTVIIDHVRGNQCDNTLESLKKVDLKQNAQNRKKTDKPTTSAYVGVSKHSDGKRWTIEVENKYVGSINLITASKHDCNAEEAAGRYRDLYIMKTFKDHNYRFNFTWMEEDKEFWTNKLREMIPPKFFKL